MQGSIGYTAAYITEQRRYQDWQAMIAAPTVTNTVSTMGPTRPGVLQYRVLSRIRSHNLMCERRARTPDHADKSRGQPIFSWHLIQEMSRIDASIFDSRWPLEIRGGIRGNQRAARWRPHCPASHGRIDNDTRPAFQTKLLSSVTSAGAAVLVEEKLGSRAT